MIDFDVFDAVLKLGIGVSQGDNRAMFDLLSRVHPLEIKRYATGREHNGWVIPHRWQVDRAVIRKDGRTLFDAAVHPMAVAGSSSSFSGRVDKARLDRHVFFSREHPDAYVFHCIFNYRPWESHWGFCIPWEIYGQWGEGEYEVDLSTRFEQDEMLVGQAFHQGSGQETVVFNAHTCHCCQANDGLSGVFAILELFKRLAGRATRHNYLAVLAPEHIGTVFYLADMPRGERQRIKQGCFVEMVGSDTPLVLQESFTGQAVIDRVARHVLSQVQPDLRVGAFRTIVGNDETVWEAPGIEVPMISVSRWPYPQYHTSRDDLSIMSPERLEETVDALEAMVDVLERDAVPTRRFEGLVALSNPRYNLYVERPDPVVEKNLSPLELRLGQVQDLLPRYLDGQWSVFEMAERFGVPFERLLAHLERFGEKGLVDMRPVESLAHYARRR
uniref:DUF4910 domain-containing protein n=1 Tax=Fundidesulfovibrio putealis TaxID=270496 RepID=A0A7C4A8L7_9BACT